MILNQFVNGTKVNNQKSNYIFKILGGFHMKIGFQGNISQSPCKSPVLLTVVEIIQCLILTPISLSLIIILFLRIHLGIFCRFTCWNIENTIYLYDLWNPEVQCRIHKGSPVVPILSRINPLARIDTYFFKIHSNIVPPIYVQ